MFLPDSKQNRLLSWIVSASGAVISETGVVFVKNMVIPISQIVVLQWSCAVIVGNSQKEEICGPDWQISLKQGLSVLAMLLITLQCWLIGSVSIDSSPFSKSGLKSPTRNNLIQDLLLPFAAVVINTSGYQKWRPLNLFLISCGSIYILWKNMKVPEAYELKIQNQIFLVNTCFSWCSIYSAVIYVNTSLT